MIIECRSDMLTQQSLQTLKEVNRWNKHSTVIRNLNIQHEDLSDVSKILSEHLKRFDIFSIEWNCIKNLSEEDLVDIILDIESTGVEVILLDIELDDISKIKNMLEELNSNCVKLSKTDCIGDSPAFDMDIVDVNILGEIFELNTNSKYSLLDSLLTLKVDSNGLLKAVTYLDVIVEENTSPRLINILRIENELKLEVIAQYQNSPFTLNSYLSMLKLNARDLGRFMEYKWFVFEELKGMDIENMVKLPKEVISHCNKNEFVHYKDIWDIVSGNYPFAKYLNI